MNAEYAGNGGLTNFALTLNQEQVFKRFQLFIEEKEHRVFILNGYAGTGKTTLIRFFIDELSRVGKKYVLMASTGRAAKIVSNATGKKASTVHSVIYKFNDFNQDLEEVVRQEDQYGVDKTGQLYLTFSMVPVNITKDQHFYIIDEACMISDVKDPSAVQAIFGSGRLLTDLLKYDANGKFIFVGDECQLPPVLQDVSPALSSKYLKEVHQIKAIETTLTSIVRQQEDNTIIHASHRIRNLYVNPPELKWGKLPLGNYKDINLHPDMVSMINKYLELIKGYRYERGTFISYSNTKCNNLSR